MPTDDKTLLDSLRAQVADDPACWLLFEADCRLEYPDGATLAIRNRLERGWNDPADLQHAMRGRGKTEAEAEEIIAADRQRMAEIWAEDERREAAARRARNRDNDLEDVA